MIWQIMRDKMSEQFEQIKLLYNQLLNSVMEVKNYISKEEFEYAISKESYISTLIQKINFLKKTIKLQDSEQITLKEISSQIEKIENENIIKLENSKQLIFQQIKNLNNRDKLSAKYTIESDQNGGSICDYSD